MNDPLPDRPLEDCPLDQPAPCPVLAGIRPGLVWEVWARLGFEPPKVAPLMGVTEDEAARQLQAASGRNSLRLVRPEAVASYGGRGRKVGPGRAFVAGGFDSIRL